MKKWLKILIAVGIIAIISIVCFFVFRAVGITDISKLIEIINDAGIYGIFVFIALYVFVNCFLCFIPATSMTFTTIAMFLYGANTKCFLTCYCAIILTSLVMDLLGRFGGSRIVKKIIGEEEYESTMQLLRTKGVVYTPVAYLLPIFPDNAICMLNGVLKTNWWVHFIEIITCRGIGCATIVYGINLLPKELTENLIALNKRYIESHIWEYIVMLTVIAFWVFMLFYIARKIDKALTKRQKNSL